MARLNDARKTEEREIKGAREMSIEGTRVTCGKTSDCLNGLRVGEILCDVRLFVFSFFYLLLFFLQSRLFTSLDGGRKNDDDEDSRRQTVVMMTIEEKNQQSRLVSIKSSI